MDSIQIKAYAKINLTLDVLRKRADGYHEVEMIMQGIDLGDLLEIRKENQGISLSCNIKELSCGPENLIWQAAELLMKDFPVIKGASIYLSKNIPVAAGLAGGSTDAAATLVGLNKLFDLKLGREALLSYAAQLGSDVSFCLYPLTSLATGRGEKIKMLPAAPRFWLVLAKPPFGVSTKEVYQHLASVEVTARPDLGRMLRALETGGLSDLYQGMGNVLEFSTFDLYPELRKWSEQLRELGSTKVMMSGSGPTLLAFCLDQHEAEQIARTWQLPGWDVYTCRSLEAGDLADFNRE